MKMIKMQQGEGIQNQLIQINSCSIYQYQAYIEINVHFIHNSLKENKIFRNKLNQGDEGPLK